MKLEGDSEFHRLALETILAMCSNDINGKRILKIEGFLSLTVESGEIFCLVIKEELDETEEEEEDGSSVNENLSAEDYLQQKLNEMVEESMLSQDSDKSVLSHVSEYCTELLENEVAIEADDLQPEEIHLCSFCQKSFESVCDLERHVSLKHSSADVDLCADDLTDQLTPIAICKWQFFDVNKSESSAQDLDPDLQSDALERNNSSEMLQINATEMWEELNSENKAEFLENVAIKPEVQSLDESFDISGNHLVCLKQEIVDKPSSNFYDCPDCQKGFKAKIALRRHMLNDHKHFSHGNEIGAESMRRHKCGVCGRLFLTSDQLFRHSRRSHKAGNCSKIGQSVYKCFCCGKVFITYGELRRHRAVHQRAKSFSCSDCDISFNSQGDQIYHRMRYHRKRTCNLCQFVCVGLVSFTEHVRSCHPGIPVYKVNKHLVCEFCSGTFGDEKHLNDHIQSKHLGLVHTCEVCGKVLGTAETLKIHRKLHEAETYRTCDVCGKQFGRLASLMEHMRSKHPENVPEKYRCSFKCHHCGLLFTRRHTLRRHTENKHEGKTFVCDVCGKIFRSKRYIVRHKKAHHAGVCALREAGKSKAVLTDHQEAGDEIDDSSFSFLVDGANNATDSLD